MRWLPALAAVVAAAVVLLVAHSGSAPTGTSPAPIAVRTSLDRVFVAFGDAVNARVVVTVDRGVLRPKTLRVVDDVAPFTLLSAKRTAHTVSGNLETLSITQRIACLTSSCLGRTVVLPRARVTATMHDGGTAQAVAAWPLVRLRSRVSAADLARSEPRLVADTSIDAPSYRIEPGRAAMTLDVVAALAAAGAAALLALEALRLARRRRPETRDELARALALVRAAEERPVPDRRRAVALLARLLHARDTPLQQAASGLAWSKPAPEPDDLDTLAERVEREQAG